MSSPVVGRRGKKKGEKKTQTQLDPNPVNSHFLQHGFWQNEIKLRPY